MPGSESSTVLRRRTTDFVILGSTINSFNINH